MNRGGRASPRRPSAARGRPARRGAWAGSVRALALVGTVVLSMLSAPAARAQSGAASSGPAASDVAASAPPTTPAGEPPGPSASRGLPPAVAARVQAGILSFLRAPVPPDRSVQNLGWDCMAAAALLESGQEDARPRLRALAAAIVALAVRDPQTRQARGWAAPLNSPQCAAGGFDAFGDGSCNRPDTVYGFQSGLAIACLAQSGRLADDAEALRIAGEAMASWRSLQLPAASLCERCTYFATSDHANDTGRYVRNMSLFVAFGAAALARSTKDSDLAELAQRAWRADAEERRLGNRGYLGSLDAQWRSRPSERDRIEDHSAAVAIVVEQLGRWLGSAQAQDHAKVVWQDWATCDNERCRTAGCGYWAGDAARCQGTFTAVHCAFRQGDPGAASQCLTYLDKSPRVTPMAIWALVLGDRGRS